MNAETLQNLYETVKQNGRTTAVFIFSDGMKSTHRLAISTRDRLMIVAPGKRNRGNDLFAVLQNWKPVVDIRVDTPKKVKSEAEIWEASWRSALARLEKSGLWADYAKSIRTALEVGYEKVNAAYTAYWMDRGSSDNANVKAIQDIDPRLVYEAENGTLCADTGIIWNMSKVAKVKKMYFGKSDNARCTKQIETALRAHTDLSVYGYSSYDVSFNYKALERKAWYSEEYKGCGNGHYYLALDATHALFYEDD